MVYPNFIVIGAQRSGTTALDRYLRQHPDIYLSNVTKELRFFVKMKQDSRAFSDYAQYFHTWAGETAIGDVTPHYLYFPYVADMIATYLPNVRLIATLRNPIDRAYSAYCYTLRTGREWRTFERAIEETVDDDLLRDYVGVGRYSIQLQRYLQHFDPAQIKIILFDDLINTPQQTLADICAYLDVDPSWRFEVFPKHSQQTNTAMYPAYPFLQRTLAYYRNYGGNWRYIWRFVRHVPDWQSRLPIRTTYPPMSSRARAKLVQLFEPEIQALSLLLKRDLTYWLDEAQHDLSGTK